MTYQILWAGTTERLEKMVNEAINTGWRPQGGVFAMYNVAGYSYYQAMVIGKELE